MFIFLQLFFVKKTGAGRVDRTSFCDRSVMRCVSTCNFLMNIICEFHFHVDARKIQLEPKNNKIKTYYNFPNATCFNKKKFVKKLQKFVKFHSFQSGLFFIRSQQRISVVFFRGNSLNFTTPSCFTDILVNTFLISANFFLCESLWCWRVCSIMKILQNVIFGLFKVKNRPKSEKWNILILWKWILFLEKKYKWKIWNGQSWAYHS